MIRSVADIQLRSGQAAGRRLLRCRRRASVLVCVMVVLLIAGLLCTQTIQTLLIVRRAGAEQRKLRQAREVIELGRATLAQHQRLADSENAKPALKPTTMTIPLGASLQDRAEMRFSPIVAEIDGTQPRMRIVVRYPLGADGEVTATWEDGR